jgi:hypothetical protein
VTIISGSTVSANSRGQLLATDGSTVSANTFEHNAWISGYFGPDDSAAAYNPGATELRVTILQSSWFAVSPTAVGRDPSAFAPSATAPWLDQGNLLPEATTDREGNARHAPVDLGPFERRAGRCALGERTCPPLVGGPCLGGKRGVNRSCLSSPAEDEP